MKELMQHFGFLLFKVIYKSVRLKLCLVLMHFCLRVKKLK